MTSADTTPPSAKPRLLGTALGLAWKIPAVLLAIPLGILAANTAGWNLGVWLLGPPEYSEGLGGFVNHAIGGLGLAGSAAILWGINRIARPALFVLVPIMAYACFVLGVWNGIGSGFDAVRVDVIKHHYANAYALKHMSSHGVDLTCQDRRVSLTDDAKAFCAAHGY